MPSRLLIATCALSAALSFPSIGAAAQIDFNGDGKADVYWQNSDTGQVAVWFMNGASIASAQLLPYRPNEYSQRNPRMADLDGDAKTDLFWLPYGYGGGSIQWRLWLMDGAQVKAETAPSVSLRGQYPLLAFADFTGDGKADFLWKDIGYGGAVLWTMNGTVVQSTKKIANAIPMNASNDGSEQVIVAAADFNGDGRADILWRDTSNSNLTMWFMNGPSVIGTASLYHVTDPNYAIAAVTDVDHDGKNDLVWYNSSTGAVVVWEMDGAAIKAAALVATVSDLNWQIGTAGDFDGDGRGDLIWQNVANGDVVVWLMDGLSIKTGAYVTRVNDLNWKIYNAP